LPFQHVLVCQEYRIPLPEGETMIGRGIGCGIRFNTAVVSRRHVKLTVEGTRLSAENLSTTTGTMVNGKKLSASISLRHGDRLAIGPHQMVVEVLEGAAAGRLQAISAADTGEPEPDEITQAGERVSLAELAMQQPPPPDIRTHTCPSCRARVAFTESVCKSCGHSWGPQHPSAITGRVTVRDLPAAPGVARPAVAQVPVIYSSDEMTLDVTVDDIQQDGMFLPTELLDPMNTRCEVTVLPDGHPAVTFKGVVAKVRASADAGGPAGLFVKFTDVSAEAGLWLVRRLRRSARA
jgi:hypothetical protein